jgi:pimeloyl-ACP methyl ester carboxylesterase
MARFERIDYTTGERVRLSYDDVGQGEVVVQLHGLTSSRAREALLGMDVLAGLRGRRLVRYDARGHGRSSGPPNPEAYAWPRLAEDLLALLDHLCPEHPVHVVGQSMGAGTVLHAALRRPDRFASLTLVIPPTAWATRLAQRNAYVHNAELIERRGLAYWSRLARRVPLPPAVRPDRPETLPDVDESLLPSIYRGAATTDLPAAEELARIELPTLVLGWVEDPAHPLATAVRLHEVLPDSRLVVARTPADVEGWGALVASHVAWAGERVGSRELRVSR